MRKLITIKDDQVADMLRQMKESKQSSVSAFFAFLMYSFDQNKKNPTKSRKHDPYEVDEDDVPRYQNPDPHTKEPYSYNDLVAWYAFDPRRGEMPDREDLKIHASMKGK